MPKNWLENSKEEYRKGQENSGVSPLLRYFGYIEKVAETKEGRVPLVFVRLEGRQEGPMGDNYILLEYSFREFQTIFGDTNIRGSYVQVLMDSDSRVATARILGLPEELKAAKEAGAQGNSGLHQLATGTKLKKITDEGVPATKPYQD